MAMLKDIIKDINEEKLLLPSFQREYVWSEEAQRSLLASVITQVPCTSSLFVEETNSTKATFCCRSIGKTVKNGYVDTVGKVFTYILDGQQRFTTLYFSFSDVYEGKTNIEKVEFHRSIYDKLKNRFFLKLHDLKKDKFLFGYEDLSYNDLILNEMMPDDVVDFIHNYVDIDSTKDFFNINSDPQKIIDGCIENTLIPLFWFFSKNDHQIKRIIKKLGIKRCENLLSENKFIELQKVYENNDIDISDFAKMSAKLKGKHKKEKEIAINYFDKLNEDTSDVWSSKIEKYLSNQISTYEIIPIKLNNINKAFATFSHINNGGTKLSTLDLICARMDDVDLRYQLIDGIKKGYIFFDSNFIKKELFLEDSFGLMVKGSLDNSFSDFFIQVLNILHFKNSINIKTGKKNEIDDLPSNFSKQEYSLKYLNEDFLKKHLKEGIEIAIKTSIFLNYHCGHSSFKNVTNKLLLLPLSLTLIYKDADLSESNIKNMISFFWINLFSGRYDSHQNINCFDDCKEIYKFIINKDLDKKNKLIGKLENEVLNVEGFATKISLTMPAKELPKESAVKNIFMFIRSNGRPFPDWIPGGEILQNDKVEIHHIIPLATASSIDQSSKKIRGNKSHPLNAAMNKTPISYAANREIKSFTLVKYGKTLASLTLDKHMIHNRKWETTTFDDTSQNPDVYELFEDRYDLLKYELRATLLDYLKFT